jgi:hypothetical protein
MQTFLSEIQRDSLLQKVRREWAWSSYYWHPLHLTTRKDVIAFDVDLLERELSESVLRSLLHSLGIESMILLKKQQSTNYLGFMVMKKLSLLTRR